jgi:hypothetical protein
MSVHIRGATGEFASQINGKFNLDNEMDKNGNPVLCDGRPVYLKADGSDSCIEYNLIAGSWQVKPRHVRGKCVAWASISSAGSIESCNTGIWLVWNSQFKRFSQQPDIVILPASPSIEVVYGATQERSQDGKKKRTDDAEYVPDLNGVFDATELLHDRWPVYHRRRSAPTKDLCEADWIEFCAAKGQWQLKRESHRGTGLGFASVSFSGPLEMCDEQIWRVWTGSKYQEQRIVISAIDAGNERSSPASELHVPESGFSSSLSGLLPSGFLNFFGVGLAASVDDHDAACESHESIQAENQAPLFGLELLALCSRR